MKRIKLIIAALLTLALTVGMFAALGGEKAQAATTKPAKAKVTANANDDGTSVMLTIAKTKNAQGYKIMVKKPGASKFTKLTTLKKDGTAARTYTAKKLTEGEYQFKVRAYLKNGSKTVWGKYSKVVKVTVGAKNASDPGSLTGVFRCDNYMIAIAEKVPAVNNYGDGNFEAFEDYILPYGTFEIRPAYPEGFFSAIYDKPVGNVLSSYTTRGDGEHVVDMEYKIEGDTLYYTRTINEDGYQEKATLIRTDEDPLDIYMTAAGLREAEPGSKDNKDNGGKTANTDLSLKDCLGKYVNDAGDVIRLYYDEENKKYRISGTKFDVLGRDDALFDEKVLKKQSDGSLSSESDLMKLETLIGSAGSPIFYGIVIDTDGNITLRTGNFASGWIDKGVTYHKQ